jgi:hypothetical protein
VRTNQVLFLVFSFTFFKIFCDFSGSFEISQIVSNLRLSISILSKYFSIELTNFIIHSTSFSSLLTKLSEDNAQSVKYLIHSSSAFSAIFTTLSAPALCPAKIGKKLLFAHLLFQSIIIAK